MKRIPKARYTEEFKVAAVQLIDAGRRPDLPGIFSTRGCLRANSGLADVALTG